MPCLSTILPECFNESFNISHFDGLRFRPAIFVHAKTSSRRSMWSSRVGVAITTSPRNTLPSSHNSLLLLLVLVNNLWNGAVALHRPNGILSHWNNPSSQANPVFSPSCFLSGTYQKADARSREKLCIPQFWKTLVYSRDGIGILNRDGAQISKVIWESQLITFLFGHHYSTSPQWFGWFYYVRI